MIYQKALKQLNTVFSKFDIRPPTKKATVRSLIQQVQCPTLTNNDFTLLINPESAYKPLQKLSRIITIWLQVLQNNQKSRQQQQSKPINRKQIQEFQYLLIESRQITGKTEFITFITQKSLYLSPTLSSTLTSKDYKQTYFCNQTQFYNPITLISQQIYFKQLNELLQKLGIFQQLIQHQIINMDHLQQLYEMINNDELFKKKDNNFNRIIKYNLQRVKKFNNQLEDVKKLVYLYQDGFVFGVARCYYLIYLSEKEIWDNKNNQEYLSEIQKFLCDRIQQVFVKLYARKITKPLLLLQSIRQSALTLPYIQRSVNIPQMQQTSTKISQLMQKLPIIKSKSLTQQQFLTIFSEIQNLLIQTTNQLKLDLINPTLLQNKSNLIKIQQQIINIFIGDGQKIKDRKILSIANSRLSNKSQIQKNIQFNKNNDINKIRNTIKSNQTNQNINNKIDKIDKIDKGQDVFLVLPTQQTVITKQVKEKIDNLVQDPIKYEKQCKQFIEKISPNSGYILQDALNFNIEQLNLLIQVGSLSTSAQKQKQILIMLNRNIIKPQITQKNLQKIFKPQLRYNVLKMLSEKLIEMDYKNTKIIDNVQFQALPQNIKKFIQTRHQFLKQVNKQLDKIIGIATIIAKIQTFNKYDICKYQTYQSFLKVLLAEKEAITYQMSFKDQKNSKQTGNFINTQIFDPFISSLSYILPAPYRKAKDIVIILDQIQFFVDFVQFTQKLVNDFFHDLQAEKQKQNIQSLKRQITRILSKWTNDCTQKLKAKKEVFIYNKAQIQLIKLNQIIRVCNNDRSQIRDPISLRMASILDTKQ